MQKFNYDFHILIWICKKGIITKKLIFNRDRDFMNICYQYSKMNSLPKMIAKFKRRLYELNNFICMHSLTENIS